MKAVLILALLMTVITISSYASYILGEEVDIPTLWQGEMKLAYSYFQIWHPITEETGLDVSLHTANLGYRLGLGQNWAAGIGLGGGYEYETQPLANGETKKKMITAWRVNLYGRWNFWNEDLGSKAGVQLGSDLGENYTRTDLLNGMGRVKALLVWGMPVGIVGNLSANAGYGVYPSFTHLGKGGGGLMFGTLGFNLEPLVTWHFPLEAAYAVEKGDFAHPDLNMSLSVVHYFTQDFVMTLGGRFAAQSYVKQEAPQVSPYAEVSMNLQ